MTIYNVETKGKPLSQTRAEDRDASGDLVGLYKFRVSGTRYMKPNVYTQAI